METKTTTSLRDSVYDRYKELFESEPILARSPGRVNLIGEHTDYNNGLVLPAAIDKNIILAIGKRDDKTIHLYSIDEEQHHEISLDALERSLLLWPDYIL